jgi:hypothetical protein
LTDTFLCPLLSALPLFSFLSFSLSFSLYFPFSLFQDRLIMETQIPEDPIFAPALEVRCIDKRVGGDVIVGTVAIDLDTKLPWNGAAFIPPRQHQILESAMKVTLENHVEC